MLRSLRLKNWKSFGSADTSRNRVQFGPLTLLVGPNASGKSNVLDALRFLQGAAFDYPLGDVLRGRWEGQRAIWTGIRGQLSEASRGGGSEFTIESEWSNATGSLSHAISVDLLDEALLRAERLEDATGYLFDTNAPAMRGAAGRKVGGGIGAALRSEGKGNSATLEFRSSRSLLGQVEPTGRVRQEVLDSAHTIRTALREAVFLDIQPNRMRDYRPLAGPHLGLSGENISPLLASVDSVVLEDIVDWLSELCVPGIDRIDFDRTQLKEVMLFLVEKGGTRVSARSMSDGTLRFLGEVTALLTSPPGTLMMLEEPDVGLHPSRIHLLARLLEHVTKDGRIQVIATTHSPSLLAHLSPASLGDVVALSRDLGSGETVASRVADLPDADTFRNSEHLERLVSTGWLERAL